jgi:hypothetical protein
VSRGRPLHDNNLVLTQRRGTAVAGLDSVPPNEIALYLSAWYCKKGRTEGKHFVVELGGKSTD